MGQMRLRVPPGKSASSFPNSDLAAQMRLILVRHGETVENATDIVQGQIPGELSVLGREQATAVGTYLKPEEIDVVYVSDLERARLSARLALAGTEVETVTDARLREQSFGIFEGGPVATLLDEMRRLRTDWDSFDPVGGESRDGLRARAREFFADIAARHNGQTVVVFTHYGVINSLIKTLARSEIHSDVEVANGSVSVLRVEGPQVALEILNATDHLPVVADSPTRLPTP